jgi:sugar lactone lactonase YvrE
MYWVDLENHAIDRACLNGLNVQRVIAALPGSTAIALDVHARKMYWTDASGGPGGGNRIRRANLDGSQIEDLVTTGVESPRGIALDIVGGKMYWTDSATDKIQRANLDGSDVEDLVTTGLISPHGIALDPIAGHMYWTDGSYRRISRANLDGTNHEVLLRTGPDSGPSGIALDLEVGKFYWTDIDPATGGIRRANLDGSNVEELIVVPHGDFAPRGIALDVAAGKMYWVGATSGHGMIQRANLDGAEVEVLVSAGVGWSPDIALDLTPCGGPDCQPNGIPDECDLCDGTSVDCNSNDVPDECDIADGTSQDCNDNGMADECEPDCDGNGVPDECQLAGGGPFPCAIIEFTPGASTGPFQIDGNEMIIPAGDVQVEYEILLSGWGNAPGIPALLGYNMVLDGESLLGSNAVPYNPGVDLSIPSWVECTTAEDCPAPLPPFPVTQSGTCGVVFPGWCDDYNPAFFVPNVCSDDPATPCRDHADCPAGAYCVDNPRFIFPSDMAPWLGIIDHGGSRLQWMGFPLVPDGGREDPDGMTRFLAGNLRMIVPDGASGTYAIRFDPGPDFTFINDREGQEIPSAIIHGQLTIGGACCMADDSCEVLLEGDCGLAGGTYVGGFCADDIDNDGKVDVCDLCPNDNPDDSDGDGVCDSDDGCPFDPNKIDPGLCGCGVDDHADSDADGIPDCDDQCPGLDDPTFAPDCTAAIPTISSWGLIILTLLLLTAGKVNSQMRHRIYE